MAARRNASLALLLLTAACSGATSTELFAPATETAEPATPVSGDGRGGGSTGASGAGSATPDGSGASYASSTTPRDGGASATPKSDAAPDPDACVAEAEPNDGFSSANAFTSCITGKVSRRDVDFVAIEAPANATTVQIEHTEQGSVAYRVFLNGVAYPAFTEDPPDTLPVVPGATYTFQIEASGGSGGDRSYELTVSFQ